MSLLPPRDKRDLDTKNSAIRISEWIWDELQKIADSEGYSRNEVLAFFLREALKRGIELPPKGEAKQSGLILPKWVWAAIEKAAEDAGCGRNEAIEFYVTKMLAEHKAEPKPKK